MAQTICMVHRKAYSGPQCPVCGEVALEGQGAAKIAPATPKQRYSRESPGRLFVRALQEYIDKQYGSPQNFKVRA